jgi:hypothetical protein
MPIYRDDAASLESHDRLRFGISDLDSIDNRGIGAGRVKGQRGAVLENGNPAGLTQSSLQDAGNMALEQDQIDESPDSEMPGGQTCPTHATHPASNTGGDGQNGEASSTAAHEPARRTQVKRTLKVKLRAMRSMVWGEGGPERGSCQIVKPLVRGMRWIGQSCTCRDEDEDGANEEPIRQGIRLVQV